MPNDVITLNALANELNATLSGGRIDRISQPEKDEVCFVVRAGGQNHLLVISANPNAPRIHLSHTKKDNPYAAPAFLMHLRKHLLGGTIKSIEILGGDRVVGIHVLGRNEMLDDVAMTLTVELMGRYSNIIVVDEEGYITDAMRHLPPDEGQLRAILPHLKYELPPMTKLSPADPGVYEYVKGFDGGNLTRYLLTGIGGFATNTMEEVLHRIGLESERTEPLSDLEAECVKDGIARVFEVYGSDQYAPCYRLKDGLPDDYYVFPYTHTGLDYVPCDSLLAAVEYCQETKDRLARLNHASRALQSALKAAVKKHERGLAFARQRLLDCKDYEKLQLYGELLTANIYRLSKGQKEAVVLNYYTDQEVKIPLDVMLTPQANAQAYYKKYAKQKRTIAISTKQVEEHTAALEYLASIETSLALAEDPKELNDVELELKQNGYLKETKSKGAKQRKPQATPPLSYEIEGIKVYVGKNNLQNDEVTFRVAKEDWTWLHVAKAHGAHVAVASPTPSDKVLGQAASLAAYYSDCRSSDKVAVDYTLRKYVHRHPSRQTGQVVYTDYKTIFVTPKEIHEN